MSASLIASLRKSREGSIEVAGFLFKYRRPTDVEARILQSGGASGAGLEQLTAQRFVIGWDRVTEADIVSGGASDPAEFSPELWAEWMADRPDLWNPIASKILDDYLLHLERVKEQVKNSQPTSNE